MRKKCILLNTSGFFTFIWYVFLAWAVLLILHYALKNITAETLFHSNFIQTCSVLAHMQGRVEFLCISSLTTFGILCALCWPTTLWISLWYLGYLLVPSCEHLFKFDTLFFLCILYRRTMSSDLCLWGNHRKLGKLETTEIRLVKIFCVWMQLLFLWM